MARYIDADAFENELQKMIATISDRMRTEDNNEPVITDYRCSEISAMSFIYAKLMLADAPTVDAVPVVHGEWKERYADDGGVDTCVCSNCGNLFGTWFMYTDHQDSDEYISLPRYCPFCDAKMDGKDNM